MLKSICRRGFLASACFLAASPLALAANDKPNVVFILADNVGYGDLGPYGGGELRGRRRHGSTSLGRRACD